MTVARLRKEASAEIERLLAFMDASDPYANTELELNGDEDDASFPESGSRACSPMEDDEESDEPEPSLGSTGHGSGGPISYSAPVVRAAGELIHDCEGDEHDGREPDEADNEPSAGFDTGEPSLGWTVDGCTSGGTGQGRWEVQDDLEVSL